jgi:hypothetical protein
MTIVSDIALISSQHTHSSNYKLNERSHARVKFQAELVTLKAIKKQKRKKDVPKSRTK